MVALTTRMGIGFPGRITRDIFENTIEPAVIDSNTPPTAFGSFVKLVSGKLQPLASGDAASVIWGLLVSAFPTQSTTTAFGPSTPPTSGVIDVMRRGYMAVTLKLGTAVKGGAVYVVTTAGGSVAVGDIVTSTSPAGGGTAVAVAGALFEGPADGAGVAEISFNI